MVKCCECGRSVNLSVESSDWTCTACELTNTLKMIEEEERKQKAGSE